MNNKLTYDGKLHLILGCMWSEKTTSLIRQYNRYTLGGNKCLMIKYSKDTRYDESSVTTHNGVKVPALPCTYLYEADHLVNNYDVICIDEVQFYKDGHIFCDKWCNSGLTVIACGLNGTFNRTQWPVISRLIPLTENITFVTAVCKETGNDAVYSNINMVPTNGETEIIGGSELYNAVDRLTYFGNGIKKFYTPELIREFADIYVTANNIKVPETIINEFIKNFNPKEMDFLKCFREYVGIV
jgi:thymidine kinase